MTARYTGEDDRRQPIQGGPDGHPADRTIREEHAHLLEHLDHLRATARDLPQLPVFDRQSPEAVAAIIERMGHEHAGAGHSH
jgi:hypothetical protein